MMANAAAPRSAAITLRPGKDKYRADIAKSGVCDVDNYSGVTALRDRAKV